MIRAVGRANTAINKILAPAGMRAFLVNHATEGKGFEKVREMIGGWTFEYDGFRQQMVFEQATLDPTWPDGLAISSHVAVGVPDADEMIDIYEIDPERRDVVPETTDDPTWKLFVIREANERFTIPEDEED